MIERSEPVVVIGMHRSGTSLLTRALQQAGLFTGARAKRNAEADFTKAINSWIFDQASATWDRPESMDWLLADAELWRWLVDYTDGITSGIASRQFLGHKRWLLYRGLDRMSEPWGFKDPRNTYTLPLWRALFPGARIIHIVRHGVDVAASLRARRYAVLQANVARYQRYRAFYKSNPWAPKRRGFGPQVRCGSLEGGFQLWALYVARAQAHTAELGTNALTLRYEDLVTSPRHELGRAARFCGLKLGAQALEEAVSTVDSRRSYSYHNDDELAAFANTHRGQLADLGYDPG